jgi:hypothetical protein
MRAISVCPKCHQPVSVPAGIDLAALVRCPMCAAEYPLAEALPPELIPVDSATAAIAASESAWAADVVRSPVAGEGKAEPKTVNPAKDEAENNDAAMMTRRVLARGYGRRRAPKSVLVRLIEVVTGGLAGCLVAYYGLAFWLGPQFKSLGFPILPLTAWVTTLRGIDGTVEQQPTGEKSAKPQPESGKTSR